MLRFPLWTSYHEPKIERREEEKRDQQRRYLPFVLQPMVGEFVQHGSILQISTMRFMVGNRYPVLASAGM